MRDLKVTKFGDFDDPVKMTKQLADAVNNLERFLQKVPLYHGDFNPNGAVFANVGSIFLRIGDQGTNRYVAKPMIYLKTANDSSSGWQELVYFGEQPQTEVTAFRGALYLQVPSEGGSSAALYLKTDNDAETNGWTAL